MEWVYAYIEVDRDAALPQLVFGSVNPATPVPIYGTLTSYVNQVTVNSGPSAATPTVARALQGGVYHVSVDVELSLTPSPSASFVLETLVDGATVESTLPMVTLGSTPLHLRNDFMHLLIPGQEVTFRITKVSGPALVATVERLSVHVQSWIES